MGSPCILNAQAEDWMCDGRTGDGVCMGAMAGGEAYEANSLHTRMFSFHVLASTRVLASPAEF